jgi:multimeric flavodoxin WrbA
MKVIAFNGSARKDGNTSILIDHVLKELQKKGIGTEVIHLADKTIRGCKACYGCFKKRDRRCAVTDDDLNPCIEKILEANGIILGTPTYFADVSTEIKALIDRVGLVSKANSDMLKRKLGAAVVAVRRAGSLHAFSTINHFFLINQMIIPGSNYWNMAVGLDKGDVERDEEGIMTMKVLGENMAWLLGRVGPRKV